MAEPFDVAVAVHDLGGSGADALFAHATGLCGLVWRPVARRLAERVHAVALDFRGHGATQAPPGHHFAWEGFGADVLTAVDTAGLRRPIGVGHSKGAAALLLAEAARPGTFGALVCFEPIIFPADEPLPPMGDEFPLVTGALRRRPEFASREQARANFAGKPPLSVLDPEALDGYVEGGLRDLADGTVRLCCEPVDEAQMYRMGSAHGAWQALPSIECPVVVACGEHTDAIPPARAEMTAGRLPQGRAVVMEGLGHFGPLEDPGAFAAVVAALIDTPWA